MNPTIPKLSTNRLILVPLSAEHLPFERDLDSNIAVMTHLHGRARTRSEIETAHQGRLKLTLDTQQAYLGYWVAFVKESECSRGANSAMVPIGLFMLLPPKEMGVSCDAELGYRLLPEYWRRGFATEGVRAVVDFVFGVDGVERICARALMVNEGSWKTMEKVGMRRVRKFRWDYMADFEREWVEYVLVKGDE